MDCTFDAHRLRDFVRALRCLSAFGDELNIVASTRDLRLSAVSASRSAFALVCFEVDFFTRYKLKPEDIPEVGSSRQSSQVPDVQISVTAKVPCLSFHASL